MFEAAAFTEPLAGASRGLEVVGIHPGERVAIIGLGAIGQLMVALAKQKGAQVTALAKVLSGLTWPELSGMLILQCP